MLILITLFLGFIGGFTFASIFAVNAYNKGYEDAKEELKWKTKRT